ncbi:hypothetical protein HMPREF1039_1088 [Megasphaera lornae]|uniref:Uncharacterized protein n=1 Tax=Megasphaera lornae TaxID=1000568 RepID=A0ABN0D0B3_9FIRM|nr:hypothetical protein HMPREF1039_1088 [Megasphaera lornae]
MKKEEPLSYARMVGKRLFFFVRCTINIQEGGCFWCAA